MKRIKKIFLFATVALALFGSVRLLAEVIRFWTDKEIWYRSIAAGIGFIFVAAIVYYAIQHLLPRPIFKTSAILITVFYVLYGINCFFLPTNFVHPASAQLFDANGQTTQGVCPVCGATFPKDTKFCPYHGKELVHGNRETVEEAGIDLDYSPFHRMMHQPGEETLTVSANSFGGQNLPIRLSNGQRLKISASGEVRDGMTGRETGPEGKEGTPFLRLDRNYRCGGNFMALCVKVGSQPWQYCGSECTVVSFENDVSVILSVNDATADLNGRYHPEWWADNAGSFEVTYIRVQ
ncbi:MAG: hypothetical protein WC663_00700 [Patescibacteria group bacterium]|jgi:hypothetical protein